MRYRLRVLPLGVIATLVGCGSTEQADTGQSEAMAEAAAAEDMTVAAVINTPASGDTVDAGFTLTLGTRNIELRPAGTVEAGTGHHHLFIDRDIVAEDSIIPAEDGIVHLGAAQSEYAFADLAAGPHVIVAVLGDHEHRRIVGARTDTVRVVGR